MEKQIKDAITEVAKQAEMNPYLETKTMNYIVNKSAQSRKRRRLLSQLGIATLSVSTVFIMILSQNSNPQQEPVSPISETDAQTYQIEPQQTQRGVETNNVFASFISFLNEIGMSYDVVLKYNQPEVTMYTIEMENETLFFLKINHSNIEENVCLVIDELLMRHQHSQEETKQSKLADDHYVLYQGNNQSILDYLDEKADEILCE